MDLDVNVAPCHLFLHCTLVLLSFWMNSWTSVWHTSPQSCFYHDESLFLCLLVTGCWHFDKRQCSWSARLPGGVWIRAGCFYICHRAPGLRPRSDPDMSPAPSRKLPIDPAWLGWEWAQASVLDAFPPYLPPHSRRRVQASEPYQSKCNFPFHLFKMHPKRSVARRGGGWGRGASGCNGDTIFSAWHMQCYLHAFVSPDHQAVSVAIKVNGTSVVSGSFILYDCERTGAIHPKTSWVLPALSQIQNCIFMFGSR